MPGGFLNTLREAGAAGWGTMQVFSRNPVGGAATSLPTRTEMRRLKEQAGIRPLFVHAPFFVNPAAEDRAMHQRARLALREEMRRAYQLAADYVVLHAGHCQGSREAAIGQLQSTLREMLAERGHILLENGAGQGKELGVDLSELRTVVDGFKGNRRIGVLLDTAHVMAAGQALSTTHDAETWLGHVSQALGLRKVRGLHLNDLAYPLGSRRDRHAHLLDGPLGEGALRVILGAARSQGWALVLETPGRDVATRSRDMAVVERLAIQDAAD